MRKLGLSLLLLAFLAQAFDLCCLVEACCCSCEKVGCSDHDRSLQDFITAVPESLQTVVGLPRVEPLRPAESPHLVARACLSSRSLTLRFRARSSAPAGATPWSTG